MGGSKDLGGDSQHLVNVLIDVDSISATHGAFAALKTNGEVVTWGLRDLGGCKIPRKFQKSVKFILSGQESFSALSKNNTLFTWGTVHKTPSVLKNIKMLFYNSEVNTFAGLTHDGKVFTWGDYFGANSTNIQMQEQLIDVKMIFPFCKGFKALLGNGKEIKWAKWPLSD